MIPHDTHLHIGSLLFEGIDQIDLTGPFEVLSRVPNATYRIYGKTAAPVRDLKGLRLTPDATLADAPPLDVLHVPGTSGISSGQLRAPPFRHGVTESQARSPHAGTASTPGATYSRAAPDLRSHPTSSILIDARNHPDCRCAPVQGTSGNDALVGTSPAAVLRGDPYQRTGGRRRRLGLCRGHHGRHRRCLAPCRRVARRRGRTDYPASHGLCAGAALRQRHAGDGAGRDSG
jgi:hypothetical protein